MWEGIQSEGQRHFLEVSGTLKNGEELLGTLGEKGHCRYVELNMQMLVESEDLVLIVYLFLL